MSEPAQSPSDENNESSSSPHPQRTNSVLSNQVRYGSEASFVGLPLSSSVGSFKALSIADGQHSSVSTLPRIQQRQTVAELLANLKNDSEETVVDSLQKLLRTLSSLTEEEILRAWGHALDLLSDDQSASVRAAASDFYSALCIQYQHNPAVVSKWILRFGDPKDLKDHKRLLIFDAPIPGGAVREVSLIHLLATLLVAWHKKAEAAREQADRRASRQGERAVYLREEQDLLELFKYVQEYIAIQERPLSANDTYIICQSLVTICKSATSKRHIENAINLFQALQPEATFTTQSLQGVLEVLCSMIIQIRGLAHRSQDVIALLLQSQYKQQVSQAILRFIDDIKHLDSSKRIESTRAQGAVVLLQMMFSDRGEDDGAMLDVGAILSSAASAMGKGHGKLEIHILVLLATLMKRYGPTKLQGQAWVDSIGVLSNCSLPSLEDDKDQAPFILLHKLVKHETVEAPKKDDPQYPDFIMADKLYSVVKIHKFIEDNFDDLDKSQNDIFFDYFVRVEDRLAAYSAKLLVRYFLRTVNQDGQRAGLVYDKVVRIAGSPTHSPENRLDCLRLLFRIRCNSSNHVWILTNTESEHLAAALSRTEGSAGNAKDDDQDQPPPVLPLWMYPGPSGLPENPPHEPSSLVFANTYPGSGERPENIQTLDMKRWLETTMIILTAKDNWEVYSYVLVHLGAQLANMQLFKHAEAGIKFLRSKLVEITWNMSYLEPPATSGLKKSNVAVCVYHLLTILIPYHAFFTNDEGEQIVLSFVRGLSATEGTAEPCIHGLLICCLEIPRAFDRYLGQVLGEMARIITQPSLSMHVLEFLSGFARNPELRKNITSAQTKSIFGICISYLNIARENKAKGTETQNRLSSPTPRSSSVPKIETPPPPDHTDAAKEFPDYVFALAFHVMNFWFLSLKLEDRVNHVGWLVRRLVFRDGSRQYIEEQSQVFIDMMQRTTFSDLGETYYNSDFADESDGPVVSKSWIEGHSIVTIQTAVTSGKTQIIKRQASGTTHATYQQRTAEIPAHHIPIQTHGVPELGGQSIQAAMLPSHIMLQRLSTAAGISSALQPVLLPENAATERALRSFDNNPTVDSHGVGVIYIGPGQKQELDILANTSASRDFDQFLESLGTKVSLENAKFNTHGLSSHTDGLYTYAWRDRLTEMVFHIPSMMPTSMEDDPQHNNKKRTIGNDFVKIIFNRSNLPFDFDTFPTQFNHVNILVTPANFAAISDNRNPFADSTEDDDLKNSFYKVQCLTNHNIPNITAAAYPKVVRGSHLALFVRQMTLNALLFALVWQHGDQSSRYISRWRNRLQEIKRLRQRVVQDMIKKAEEAAAEEAAPAASTSFFGARMARKPAGERTSLYPEDRELATVRPVADFDSALAGGNLVDILDFSKWSS